MQNVNVQQAIEDLQQKVALLRAARAQAYATLAMLQALGAAKSECRELEVTIDQADIVIANCEAALEESHP